MNFFSIVLMIIGSGLGYLTANLNHSNVWGGLLIGLMVSGLIVLMEINLKKVELKVILSGLLGLFIALIIANFFTTPLQYFVNTLSQEAAVFFNIFIKVIFGYLGIMLGIKKGLEIEFFKGGFFNKEQERMSIKVLDTSVIIDGRIADICETGFIEGELIVSQFVLRELQQIADSSDSLKRNRGRRGLDVLQRMQKNALINIKIVDDDFPRIKDVDDKLIALCQKRGAQVITNDFNLNKVAELQGVGVLNINQLANALKPVVLPGEIMNVFVIKEGKEHGQGVAYLDDGTMIVIDNARREIGRNIEVAVTSVLQTTAGRMIFARSKEDVSDLSHAGK